MKYEEMLKKLTLVLKPNRLQHSLGVSATAVELAILFGADEKKARLAGMLHDCARNVPKNNLLQMAQSFAIVIDDAELCEPVLLHAKIGSCLANTLYGIDDDEICQAIARHTVGAKNMSLLDKIIYLADFIEPGRDFPGVEEIRAIAKQDLDKALLAAIDHTLQYIIANKGIIHPATVDAHNWLLQQEKQ